jgi:hypothetical protein
MALLQAPLLQRSISRRGPATGRATKRVTLARPSIEAVRRDARVAFTRVGDGPVGPYPDWILLPDRSRAPEWGRENFIAVRSRGLGPGSTRPPCAASRASRCSPPLAPGLTRSAYKVELELEARTTRIRLPVLFGERARERWSRTTSMPPNEELGRARGSRSRPRGGAKGNAVLPGDLLSARP